MTNRRLKIAALGSSFAAGPGINPTVEPNARRSGQNYPSQLATLLNADLVDLTVSGATLLNVLNERQETLGKIFDPQLDSLPKDADIVTLTGGGNDLGYSGGMMCDAYRNSPEGPTKDLLADFFTLPLPPSLSVEKLTQRFLDVIDKIQERAPSARIYLVDYIAVFGDATQPETDTPLPAERILHYRGQAAILARAYRNAAESRGGVVLVEMSKLSAGHEVGSKQPWVTGFELEMFIEGMVPYHPKLEAHVAAAAELHRRIMQTVKDKVDA
ncbi:unnamed protein product [Zymoseptoria tritici ST99CH_1A5]|uniref:SGNH hydrolase-type esterase domain-containing protein n=3 Tax=Zymoseptoria tritici TaxID=1047171 RepID=A0A1X7RK34_ZYMT9|nr:unnamed protein product [Zymoseptoria tritici ST99CH_3D7]SMR46298.1 unnamed protein product [Zymoseptoria tritici ST99CH_1E4]SMR47547.1 unnamed protein product [Zymoseptoria tritici ST99CH_3D1]SMY21450.1 unnamed protein product [Zymoseptoria tritici ST99CH_1A5]